MYHVNYDEGNWKLIGKLLKHNHQVIHPANRLQIVNALTTFVILGMIDRSLPLCVGEYVMVSNC